MDNMAKWRPFASRDQLRPDKPPADFLESSIRLQRLDGGKFPFKLVPDQFCKWRLQNCFIGPRLCKGLHVAEVARGDPLHLRELSTEVVGQSLDNFGSPAVLTLGASDLFPDSPVKQHQFLEGDRCAQLGCSNSCYEQRKKILVAFRIGSEVGHGPFLSYQIANRRGVLGAGCELAALDWQRSPSRLREGSKLGPDPTVQ